MTVGLHAGEADPATAIASSPQVEMKPRMLNGDRDSADDSATHTETLPVAPLEVGGSIHNGVRYSMGAAYPWIRRLEQPGEC